MNLHVSSLSFTQRHLGDWISSGIAEFAIERRVYGQTEVRGEPKINFRLWTSFVAG